MIRWLKNWLRRCGDRFEAWQWRALYGGLSDMEKDPEYQRKLYETMPTLTPEDSERIADEWRPPAWHEEQRRKRMRGK